MQIINLYPKNKRASEHACETSIILQLQNNYLFPSMVWVYDQ